MCIKEGENGGCCVEKFMWVFVSEENGSFCFVRTCRDFEAEEEEANR